MKKNGNKSVTFGQFLLVTVGAVLAMALGMALVAVTLIASPIITVLVLIFLLAYGVSNAFGRKKAPKRARIIEKTKTDSNSPRYDSVG